MDLSQCCCKWYQLTGSFSNFHLSRFDHRGPRKINSFIAGGKDGRNLTIKMKSKFKFEKEDSYIQTCTLRHLVDTNSLYYFIDLYDV